MESARLGRWLRPQDFAWALFVVVLLVTAPERNNDALILVPLIGAFQILEPRLAFFRSKRGQAGAIALKLLLCYALIGFSDAIYTYYYSIFLIPVVSAAIIFDFLGVVIVIALAIAGYFSFLLPQFGLGNSLPPGYLSLMWLRGAFYAIVGFLVYEQASAKRAEMERTQEALRRLLESEASLRRTERLAALGQLTAGLAHELRNPLGTIKASAEMLNKPSTQAQPALMAEMSSYIDAEVDRMNGLIASFLDFARPLRMKASSHELKPLLESIARQKSKDANIVIHGDDLTFDFDEEMLRVAILNLVQNAVQASPAKQDVIVNTSVAGEHVRILITDHGKGIEAKDLESIFNPFFTTKPQGVGLGLALVSKIVDEHNGRITVFSEPGRGTTFEMTLPRVQNG